MLGLEMRDAVEDDRGAIVLDDAAHHAPPVCSAVNFIALGLHLCLSSSGPCFALPCWPRALRAALRRRTLFIHFAHAATDGLGTSTGAVGLPHGPGASAPATRASMRPRNENRCHRDEPTPIVKACATDASHASRRSWRQRTPRLIVLIFRSCHLKDHRTRGMQRTSRTMASAQQAGLHGSNLGRLVDHYRTMVRIRAFEETALAAHKAGEIPGPLHVSIGQEGVAAGVCANLQHRRPHHLQSSRPRPRARQGRRRRPHVPRTLRPRGRLLPRQGRLDAHRRLLGRHARRQRRGRRRHSDRGRRRARPEDAEVGMPSPSACSATARSIAGRSWKG